MTSAIVAHELVDVIRRGAAANEAQVFHVENLAQLFVGRIAFDTALAQESKNQLALLFAPIVALAIRIRRRSFGVVGMAACGCIGVFVVSFVVARSVAIMRPEISS